MDTETNLQYAADTIAQQIDVQSIDASLVLGSGLSDLNYLNSTSNSEIAEQSTEILFESPYTEIPGMPKSSAPTHKGVLSVVKVGSLTLLVFQGRFHLYEGHSPRDAATTSYLSKALGAKQIIFTNAAGGLNPDLNPGDIMLVNDHINFTGQSPLTGNNDCDPSLRFPDMSRAYDPQLQALALSCAKKLELPLKQGIYAGVNGPELETSAERRHMRTSGCDAIGMSLVMETIGAVHCGLEVLALSAITNVATGGADQPVDSIETILENADIAAKKLETLIPTIIQHLPKG